MISFAGDIYTSRGQRPDWPRFARWHYRSHQIGLVRSIALLWHGQPTDRDEVRPLVAATDRTPTIALPRPIGIAVFVSPPMSLWGRNKYFGRRGDWSPLTLRMMNQQLILLQRLVLHPTYRGSGLAVPFLEDACERTGVRWVETLTGIGQTLPVFERAGFVRVGRPPDRDAGKRTRASQSAIYGGRTVTEETFRKSAHNRPVYYVRRNTD